MAEKTQEKKTFKYGEQDYSSDDFLRAHANYKQSFLNFAKEKGLFDDESLKELSKALDARANAVREGKTFSADGILEGDVVNNVTYKVDKPRKHGLSRKDKYLSQDITEWAKHYTNKLIGQLKTSSNKSSKTWDISKYGLGAYLTGQGLDAQDIFEKYDVRNPNQPDSPRSYAQRRQLLLKHLPGYKSWLKQQGFDYTQNNNDWDDNFGNDFDQFVTDYTNNENYDINSLTAALRKFGAGDKYTKAFTSNKWELAGNLGTDGTQGSKTEEQRRNREKIQGQNTYITSQYDRFRSLADNDLGGKTYFSTPDGQFEMSDDEWVKWTNTHTNDGDAYMKQLQSSYYQNPFDTTIAAEYLPVANRLGALQEVNIDRKIYKYDPRTIDREKMRFVAFNPVTGEIRHAFIGDIEEEKQALLRKWRIDNGYEKESDKYLISEKQGGIISMQMGGGFDLATAVRQELEKENNARAQQTGNTPEVQKARDRVVSNGDQSFVSESNSIRDANAGFTDPEIARLASIGADIASLFFDPLTGTAIGVGSTLTNFGADIADDGFQWEDVKNLGINLGFDLLGAIPVFGDAAGTGSKIIKNLAKWTPRIMSSLAAYQGVKNFDGMMESWNKFASGDADKKLTVQDWRNIAQSISLITGGVRATRNKVAQNKVKKQAKVDDVVGVNVRDKATGEVKQILVDGETAKNIRAAAGDKTKIEAELGKLEVFKDKFGENGTFEVNTKNNGKLQFPIGRTTKADGSKEFELRGLKGEGKAEVSDVYDFSKVPKGYGTRPGLKIPWLSDKLNTWHHDLMTRTYNNRAVENSRGAMTTEQINAEVAKLQANIDKEIQGIKKSTQDRATRTKEVKQELAPNKERLDQLINKLNGVPDEATLQGIKSQLESDIITTDARIQARQKLVAQAESEYNKLKNKKRIPKKIQEQYKKDKKSALGKLQGQKNALSGEHAAKQQHQEALDKIQQDLADRAAFSEVQPKVERLERILQALDKRNHTNAYERLRKIVQDYQTNHSNVGGRNINWDMNDIIRNAGITDAFKYGGSVNRNKLNKFLNYAKG